MYLSWHVRLSGMFSLAVGGSFKGTIGEEKVSMWP